MRDAILALIALSIFAVLSSPSMSNISSEVSSGPSAKAKGQMKGQGDAAILVDRDRDGRVDMDVEEPVVTAVFTVGERERIIDYYRDSSTSTRGLPPGIAKNVARGKPLPPGIAKKYLPSDLESGLPARAKHRRVIVDDDVLLVAVATGLVVDMLENVIN